MSAPLGRRCAAEAMGTFMLVLIGPGAAAVDRAFPHVALGAIGVALAFFFALFAAIAAFAPVSGAHFNPAVTIAFWSLDEFPRREIAPYLISQCAGATVAAFALRAVLGDSIVAAATIPAISTTRAFAVELVFSAILMSVIIRVSNDDLVSKTLACTAVAGCVGGLALLGALTGSSMNPARSLGPAIASGAWRAHWIYWVAPVGGMLIAAQWFRVLKLTRSRRSPAIGPRVGIEGPFEGSEPA